MGSATSIIKLSLQSNQYEQGLRGAKRQFEEFTASIGINMKKMTAYGLAAGAAASAINGLTSAISTAISEGTRMASELEGVRMAFKRLDQPGLLDNLREATHGTVNDLELMKQAVKFDNFNLSLEQMGTMLAFAQQQAKDTGQDVGYLVDSIVTGLGRKSLPILDNLGLSATEIKDRMKETGDMTKAVADIIKERMAAAGGYVETASDRAAKATADLENAMTSLGETFAPLVGTSDSLWNSIKIGAINALNTAVKPLIQALSEAGVLGQGARSKAGFNNLGGNSKVDRMIGRLGNGKSQGAYNIYQQQLGEFDKYINNKRFQIAAYGGDNSGVAQSAKARLQTELDGALRMREEYVRRAKELHDKVPSPVSAPTAGGGGKTGGKGGNTTSEVTYASDSIVAQQKLVQDLTKKWNEAGADVRDQYVKPLVEAEAKLRDMQNAQVLSKEQAQGKLLGNTPDGKAVEIPISSDIAFETWMAGVQEKLAGLKLDPIEIPIETTTKDVKDIAKAASITAAVVGSIGDAFNAIEDPAAKVAGTVMQAIASVALGYAQATTSAAKLGPWAWIAFAASGLATMISTISAIHSSTGYANGGVIKGNSYSGDNIGGMIDGGAGGFVGLNAGEIVLNAVQQNSLAQILSGNLRSIHVVGKISGTDIILSADRTLMTQGKQLAVWGR